MNCCVPRTTERPPLDLRRMMDAPGQHFAVAQAGAEIAGALWLVEEGGLPPELSRAVWAGFRRPRGNLVAQSLAAHGGSPLAATLKRPTRQPHCGSSPSPAGRHRPAADPQCQRRRLSLGQLWLYRRAVAFLAAVRVCAGADGQPPGSQQRVLYGDGVAAAERGGASALRTGASAFMS